MVESKKKLEIEENRLKRLEENKKRMQELNLNKLASALHLPKPSPMKKVKNRAMVVVKDPASLRRSSRVANGPAVSYKEAAIEPMGRLISYRYNYKRRDLSNRVYASDEEREYTIEKAEELRSSLEAKFPSFVKPMLQSHVTGGFWLGLPVHFCKEYLPQHDEMIDLVDEEGAVFPTKYLALKTGLSGGWRGFAIDHELVDGDSLVFQLNGTRTFKVFIIRVNPSDK